MNNQNTRRPVVRLEFQLPDGRKAQRSKLDDFQTVRVRIIQRIRKAVDDDVGNRVLMPGINAYNCGEYEEALNCLTAAAKQIPVLSAELAPHIRICRRAVSATPSEEDLSYTKALAAWHRRPRIFRIFVKGPDQRIRCKYCGHFTPYIDPDHGFAYMGTNNCAVCERGYPVPDFSWDGIDGQAYIYYRHSVKEDAFYTEFEEHFDPYPDHRHFLVNRS